MIPARFTDRMIALSAAGPPSRLGQSHYQAFPATESGFFSQMTTQGEHPAASIYVVFP
jgi:hypothetical protein